MTQTKHTPNKYSVIPVISLNPELNGWTVMDDGEDAKPIALSFPVKADAKTVCDYVNDAYKNGRMGNNVRQLVAAMESLLKAYDSIMPGIAHIAVQDYALLNDAPAAARAAIAKATGEA